MIIESSKPQLAISKSGGPKSGAPFDLAIGFYTYLSLIGFDCGFGYWLIF
jgi:hypothetical protein